MARPLPLSLAIALLTLGVALTPARAHQLGLSRGEYQIDGAVVRTALTFARGELATAVDGVDRDRNGRLEQAELDAAKPLLERRVIEAVRIDGDAKACPGRLEEAVLVEEDGLTVSGRYDCGEAPAQLAFDLSRMLDGLIEGHRHVAFTSTSRVTVEHITFRGQSTFRVFNEARDVPDGDERRPRDAARAVPDRALAGLSQVVLGIVHVTFLAGLLLAGDRPRSMLAMVGAFIAGYAVTLSLTLLRIIAVPEHIASAAVALTVTYVGVENWFLTHPERRWRIALPFGAIHGLGFALGFGTVPKGGGPLADALGYHAGVLGGVFAVAVVVAPMVLVARRSLAFRDRGMKVLSAGMALAGLVWFALAVAR